MDIRQALLTEHSKTQVLAIAAYIGNNPERFRVLMDIFFHEKYRLVQRSAWALSYVIDSHPSLIQPYLAQTIDLLNAGKQPDAVPRNILRILQKIEVPEYLQGKLMDICFTFVQEPGTPIAIKAFSLTVLHNLSKQYPEILSELQTVIRERLPYETAAFHSRARKILSDKRRGR
jgi:hypothetical protein